MHITYFATIYIDYITYFATSQSPTASSVKGHFVRDERKTEDIGERKSREDVVLRLGP